MVDEHGAAMVSNTQASRVTPQPPAPSAYAWQVAAAAVAPELEALRIRCAETPPPPLHVLRSSQADALRLDAELGGMLQEQLNRLFEHFLPGQAAQIEPELRALLALLVFGLSVMAGRATPGAELLNLRYRNERAVAANPKPLVGATGVEGPGLSRGQRIALGLGTAVLPYAWSRLDRVAREGEWGEEEAGTWRRRVWRVMRWCEGAVAAAALTNSWVFLVRGDYRSLLERLVGARLVWRQASMTRIISFEYLNRQLVWQQLSEALLLLLPLVDTTALRRAAMRALPRPARQEPGSESAALPQGPGGTGAQPLEGQPPGADADAAAAAVAVAEAAGPCPVCGTSEPLTAMRALPCRHVFCYYCLRSNTQADVGYCCPLDGVRVAAMRRVGGGGGVGKSEGPGKKRR